MDQEMAKSPFAQGRFPRGKGEEDNHDSPKRRMRKMIKTLMKEKKGDQKLPGRSTPLKNGTPPNLGTNEHNRGSRDPRGEGKRKIN